MMKAIARRVWDSVVRHPWPRTDRERSLAVISNLFLHIHPAHVRRDTLRLSATLGLGLISFVLFLVLCVTGVLLMLYYSPHPEGAYRSMKDLEFTVVYGPLIRNLHRWAAHGMVIAVVLHMCRVFYTASYRRPRELNWVVGVGLLVLTLGLSFTGYLLPWDQLAYWAITVGTSIAAYAPVVGDTVKYLLLGGHTISESTLIRFYVLHCALLPAAAFVLVGIHFWRIRKDGGLAHPSEVEPPPAEVARGEAAGGERTYGLMAVVGEERLERWAEPDDTVPAWPHLLQRELIVTLIVVNLLMVVSFFWNAPLEEFADPTNTPNPAKAPWYFLGLQELVHYSAFLGGVAAPAAIVLGLVVIPYLDRGRAGTGVWWHESRRRSVWIFTVAFLTISALTLVGTLFRGPYWAFVLPW